MNDQPPPPDDRKPRRRAAPRKRSPAKRPAKTAETLAPLPVNGDAATEPQAPRAGRRGGRAQPKPSTPRAADVAAGSSAQGASAPAAVAVLLDPVPLADPGTRGDAPATDGPLVAAPDADARAQPAQDETAHLSEAAIAPAPSPAAQASAASAPELRQAALRPGELIRVPLSVRWRDLDAFNHVNNSKYLSYLEEARLRWMLTMPGMGLDDNVAPVVAASNLNYRRPIGWPGDVVVELFVERLGSTSVTIGHRIVDSTAGGVTYCDGNVVMVWIDRTSGRAAPLPPAVRAACSTGAR